MKLDFLDGRHKERYIKICFINSNCLDDREYMTAAYMLSISEQVFDKAISYITEYGIRFDDLLKKQDLTPAIYFYIQVAFSLYRWEEIRLNLSDIKYLDYPHLFGIINGIRIYTNYDHIKKNYENLQKTIETIQSKEKR